MIYAIGKFIFYVYFKLFFRAEVTGRDNIPKSGGVIICSNHIHFLDPLLIAPNVKRKVHNMAKQEIFKNWFFTFILTALGAFPVDRKNPGMAVYKQSVQILKDGKVLCVFAQGTRFAQEADAAKAGAALFALKAGACVVPACITADYKLFSKPRLAFGEPIYFNEYKDRKVRSDELAAITEKIMKRITELGRQTSNTFSV